jgi:hypothetical protein
MTAFPLSSRVSRLVVALALLVTLVAVAARPSPAAADHGGEFDPLPAPQRLADTRPGHTTADGQVAGVGAVAADGVLRIPVAGRAGVPTAASAVVLNVTAVDPTAAGFLTVYPCDADRPVASNVNYYAGVSIPNAVVTDLSAAGEVCIYTLSTTDVVVDIAGSWPAGAVQALDAPRRLLDTRAGGPTVDGQASGGGQRAAGSTLALQVGGRGGVPADADAVVLNVTAVEPGDLGFLTVYPCDAPRPTASNVNYYPGTTIPNAAVSRVAPDGTVCIYTLADTHLAADVTAVLPETAFTALPAPQRVLDTRPGGPTADGQLSGTGLQPAGAYLQLRVGGRVGVPAGAGAVVLNVTAVDPTAPGFVTVFPAGADLPTASNVNYYAGTTIPNTVVARLGRDASVCLYTHAATHLVVDVAGYLPVTAANAPAPTSGCPAPAVIGSTAADLLQAIPIAPESPAGFDRVLFGDWTDADGDGCAVDEEVVIRDSLEPPVLTPTCDAVSGRWYSPYDGATWTLRADVEIDHVVSLKESWDSGAHAWTAARRNAMFQDVSDTRTLRVVSATIDDTKQTNDPANWMPPLESDWCRYLADHIAIKARWGLSMDAVEHADIAEMLTTKCPGLRIAAWPAAPA